MMLPIGNLPAALVFFNVAAVWLLVFFLGGHEHMTVLVGAGVVVLAMVQIGVDVVLRVRAYGRIRQRAVIPTILTREGWIARPRRPAMDVLEAALSEESGGQYFFGYPMWLTGVTLLLVVWSISAW